MIADARFTGNEYFAKYAELIESRTTDMLNEGEPGTEVHHIVPGSIGGSNDKSNLVALKTEEHYLAHYLLAMAFITNNPDSVEAKKMAFAWDNISNFKRFKRTLLPRFSKKDAKDYAKIREVAKKVYADPEYRRHQLEGLQAWHADPENKRAISERIKKTWENPEFRKKMQELVKTDEWKKRQHAGAIKAAQDPEWQRKVQEACVARNKDPEYRKRRLEGIRRACGMTIVEGDSPAKAQWQEHMREAAERRKNDTVWRENNARWLETLHSDPEIRKRATEAQKKTLAEKRKDPAYAAALHKKQCEAARKRVERMKADPEAYAAFRKAMLERSACRDEMFV